jgi:hypothetical protein
VRLHSQSASRSTIKKERFSQMTRGRKLYIHPADNLTKVRSLILLQLKINILVCECAPTRRRERAGQLAAFKCRSARTCAFWPRRNYPSLYRYVYFGRCGCCVTYKMGSRLADWIY